jgi:hypothetical protein
MCNYNVSSELFTPTDVGEMREGECFRVTCKLFFVRFSQTSNVSTNCSKSRRYEFHVLDSTPLWLLGACWTGGQWCGKADRSIVATFHCQSVKNSTGHTECIVCLQAHCSVGIVHISVCPLRPCTPTHSMPFPKSFQRHTVPRQRRGKKNHHP